MADNSYKETLREDPLCYEFNACMWIEKIIVSPVSDSNKFNITLYRKIGSLDKPENITLEGEAENNILDLVSFKLNQETGRYVYNISGYSHWSKHSKGTCYQR